MPGREEEDVAHPQPGRMQSKSEMAPTTLQASQPRSGTHMGEFGHNTHVTSGHLFPSRQALKGRNTLLGRQVVNLSSLLIVLQEKKKAFIIK